MKLRNPFKSRNNTAVNSNIPPEVQAYTKAEHRDRMGKAWLVGVLSLVVTALLILGLFFGGRWVYRKITGNSNSTPETQITEDGSGTKDTTPPKEQPKETDNPSTSTPTPTPNQPTPTPTPNQPTPTPTPVIPRTGPESDE
jgi:cytoskeletal protein RodZ